MTFSFDSWWVILKILETTTSAVSAQWRKSRKTACSDNSGTPYRNILGTFRRVVVAARCLRPMSWKRILFFKYLTCSWSCMSLLQFVSVNKISLRTFDCRLTILLRLSSAVMLASVRKSPAAAGLTCLQWWQKLLLQKRNKPVTSNPSDVFHA